MIRPARSISFMVFSVLCRNPLVSVKTKKALLRCLDARAKVGGTLATITSASFLEYSNLSTEAAFPRDLLSQLNLGSNQDLLSVASSARNMKSNLGQ